MIERDGGQGHPSLACADGQTEGRFGTTARLLGNDNNLSFSAGRQLGVPDSNEIVRLHVPGLLAAR